MNLSFQEKSLWVMLASLVVGFGFYFANAFGAHAALAARAPGQAADLMAPYVGLFIAAVVLLVAISVAGHVVIALADRNPQTDERDHLIALKGTSYASYVLATGVFLALTAAVFTRGNFIFTHVLLAFWVLAQLVAIGSQLVMYRRGA
ncbi:MAG: hypothetical protein IPL06_01780 [Betaproteobacteria bacterium]|nr:hypothetical protein [Betaproteobacteria bacterium]